MLFFRSGDKGDVLTEINIGESYTAEGFFSENVGETVPVHKHIHYCCASFFCVLCANWAFPYFEMDFIGICCIPIKKIVVQD